MGIFRCLFKKSKPEILVYELNYTEDGTEKRKEFEDFEDAMQYVKEDKRRKHKSIYEVEKREIFDLDKLQN